MMSDDWLDPITRALLAPDSDEAAETDADVILALAATARPRPPRNTLRQEILTSTQRMDHPALPDTLIARTARLLELDGEAARGIFEQRRRPTPWPLHPAPGVDILPVRPGPLDGFALCCLVRLLPGVEFPAHTHGGEETTLVLEGGFRDDDGHLYWSGDAATRSPGPPHRPRAVGLDPCVCLVVARGGVTFLSNDPHP